MCLIGLLLAFRSRKELSSSHRRSEHPRREESRSRRHEKDERKDAALLTEDALARLCLSLEKGLLEEQRRWRDQELLDRQERQRLGLEPSPPPPPPPQRPPSEEAPPYSLRDENARQPTPVPAPAPEYQADAAAAGSPERRSRDPPAPAYRYCCPNCLCTAPRVSSTVKRPTVPELDGGRSRE
ncbi:adecf32c-c623-4e25-8e81-d0a483bd64d9 [Thermothielavioides terrestris]|uniref:Adecf32c-c623-4e25-8e81-d0a483bd64d9 n=1 Tax=Thermothielavioides terrestris TaxID=2587410 RepID=A0A446B6G1_9PEZI|nr:adecf32c-c623-4e25-8e81-d0a483bd64d9 [Thermothielavioides terrestris]